MTGDPTAYTKAEERDMARWALIAGEAWGSGDVSEASGMEITGEVEWAGEKNPNPHRTLKAGQLSEERMAELAKALRGGTEGRLKTYRATTWQGQLSALQGTKAGRQALSEHLGAQPRTQARWAAGERQPSRANREAIAAAYEARATDPTAVARSGDRSAHRVAEAINGALSERFGAEIRITKITGMTFTDD